MGRRRRQDRCRQRRRAAWAQEGAFLPEGYALDQSEPDIVVLCRPDGAVAARFSAMGATEEISRSAEVDRERREGTRKGQETGWALAGEKPLADREGVVKHE